MRAATDSRAGKPADPRPIRLGILVSHPIQYFVPVYRELATDPRVDLTVIYRTRVGVDAYHDPGFGQTLKWDIPLLEGYRSEFLSAKTALTGFEPKVVATLLRHRFDVLILHGYDRLTNLMALAVAKIMGTRVIIRGDTRLQRHHIQAPFAKRAFKTMLFKLFDGFLAIGSLNRAYYAALGGAPDRIFFAPFCVDNAAFALGDDQRQLQRQRYRAANGLPDASVVVLYASKFSKRKRPGDLISAFARISQQFPEAWLVIAGSGEEESALRARVAEFGLERVRFVGFQNQSALPALYAASDIFVLPSDEEPWGLVINEVMAAGLPVIVSDEVGAAPDLVSGAGTGIVYPIGDVEALSKALASLLQSEKLRLDMGAKGRELIRDWGVSACVQGTVTAAVSVMSTNALSGRAGKHGGV